MTRPVKILGYTTIPNWMTKADTWEKPGPYGLQGRIFGPSEKDEALAFVKRVNGQPSPFVEGYVHTHLVALIALDENGDQA